jgi:hypothetical protein
MPRKSGTIARHEVLSIVRCKFFLPRLSSQRQQSRFNQFVNIQLARLANQNPFLEEAHETIHC